MFKMNKQSVWPVTIIFSVGLMVFQSCAAPSPQVTTTVQKEKPMGNTNYIQIVNFNLEGITHDDFLGIAESVAPNFASLPGLISKVWLSDKANNTYGGVYSWESQEVCETYRNGELYAGALATNPNFVNLLDNGFDALEKPSAVTGNLLDQAPKYIQVVNFNLEGITHDDFMGVANDVAPNFAALPGLINKVWLSDEANNTYGGVYSWESQEACTAYRSGELYAGALANNPSFVNLSDNGFVVLEEPSKITHMK
jgi:heme-degrading monooxygenase HmoA